MLQVEGLQKARLVRGLEKGRAGTGCTTFPKQAAAHTLEGHVDLLCPHVCLFHVLYCQHLCYCCCCVDAVDPGQPRRSQTVCGLRPEPGRATGRIAFNSIGFDSGAWGQGPEGAQSRF